MIDDGRMEGDAAHELCRYCGLVLRPGDDVVDVDERRLHRSCVEGRRPEEFNGELHRYQREQDAATVNAIGRASYPV
jgi:hypothetical protein